MSSNVVLLHVVRPNDAASAVTGLSITHYPSLSDVERTYTPSPHTLASHTLSLSTHDDVVEYTVLLEECISDQPPLIGGINATVSPSFKFLTSPMGIYSSFNANVIFSSSCTKDANLG